MNLEGLPKLKGNITVAGIGKVKAPAGEYEAIRVDWEYDLDQKPQRRCQLFASGVGMGKEKTQAGDLRLKEFHAEFNTHDLRGARTSR